MIPSLQALLTGVIREDCPPSCINSRDYVGGKTFCPESFFFEPSRNIMTFTEAQLNVCEINRLMFGFELAPVCTNLLTIRSIVYLIHVQKMKQKGGNCSSHLLFLLTVTHLFPHGKLCRLSLWSRLYRLLGSD